MHPDARDTRFRAIVDYLVRQSGRGEQQRPFNGRCDLLNAGEAGQALYVAHIRIHGHDVVAAPPEFTEHASGKVLRIARDAYQGQAFPAEEVIDSSAQCHGDTPLSTKMPEETTRNNNAFIGRASSRQRQGPYDAVMVCGSQWQMRFSK